MDSFGIDSDVLDRRINFTLLKNGQVYVDLNGMPGTEGLPVCAGGFTTGRALKTTKAKFEKTCTSWMQTYIDTQASKPNETKKDKGPRTSAACIKRSNKNLYRRAFSEPQLLDAVGINFKDGESYHCLTGGDVDGLSYLKAVIRQQNLEYCLFSTWCMAIDDVLQFKEWTEKGKILKLDAYVGEIFKGSYSTEYARLVEVVESTGGKVVMFRNHSKTFAGYGKKFYFGIETSANINTNPRTENGCITIGKDIFDFYHGFYSKIKSFGS